MNKKPFYTNDFGCIFGNLIPTPIGRAALLHLDKPSDKFDKKYQIHLLFSKSDESLVASLKLLTDAADELLNQKYGDTANPGIKYPALRDGDEKPYSGFFGSWYIKAASKRIPETINASKQAIDPAMIMPGMLVRCVITPGIFDEGVFYQLSTVQLIKDDGVRYYGGPDPKSLLTALESDGPSEPTSEVPAEVAAQASPEGKKLALNML